MEFVILVKGIKETCTKEAICNIVAVDFDDKNRDTLDWVPYKCSTCGRYFDY